MSPLLWGPIFVPNICLYLYRYSNFHSLGLFCKHNFLYSNLFILYAIDILPPSLLLEMCVLPRSITLSKAFPYVFFFSTEYNCHVSHDAETSTWETERHTWRIGELMFIMPVGPEELTLQALSPKQRGYRIFIYWQAWLCWFTGLRGLDDCKEQDKGEWDKLQFLVLWVPTFWDWSDPDFARSKLSYRGRRSRKSYKILTFPFFPLSWCFYHSLKKSSSHVL